jgi:hypothetical protein
MMGKDAWWEVFLWRFVVQLPRVSSQQVFPQELDMSTIDIDELDIVSGGVLEQGDLFI